MDVLRPWQKYPWTFYDHGLFVEKNAFFMKIPEIRFILDESIEYGVNMSRLIDDVIEHDHSKGTESEDGEKQDTAETEDEE